jgi:hypothetical protein
MVVSWLQRFKTFFSFVSIDGQNKVECLSLARYFRAILMIAGKARAYPTTKKMSQLILKLTKSFIPSTPSVNVKKCL